MPIVWIPAPHRDLSGNQESVRVDGSTIRDVIEQLDKRFPGMKDRLCDHAGLRAGIAVAVDSQISSLGLRQTVAPDSEVHFLPAISGG